MDSVNASEQAMAAFDGKPRPFPRFIEVTRLARAYVPIQKMCETYNPEKGLRAGTIYPELDMPYAADAVRCVDDAEQNALLF